MGRNIFLRNIKIGVIIKTVIMYGLAILMIIPFLWMISTSLKNQNQVFDFPIKWIPRPVNIEGYEYLWKRAVIGVSFGVFYINSIKVTLIAMVGTFFSCSLAAYGYTKIDFKGRDTLFLIKISTMMIPTVVTMLPTFIVFRILGLLDHHAALWLPAFFGSAFGTFMLKQFFMGIPNELCESAFIDGAGHFKIYWNIVLPHAKPALTSLLILTFVGVWNNYESPLLYLRNTKLFTLPIALKVISNDELNVHYPGLMAGCVCSVVPIILIFILGQKYFVEGISFTGVKG